MSLEASSAPLWQGRTALLVDDYPTIRRMLRKMIEEQGLVCQEAENGLQAQEAVRTSQPDLVLTDLVMPEMDGFELTEALKGSAQYRHIPVIVVSTHSDSRYIIKALKSGADDYLTKPIDKNLLVTVLHRVFDHGW